MSKFKLNPVKLLFIFGFFLALASCKKDEVVIDPGTGSVNVADGFYIAKDGVNPTALGALKAETVEDEGFKSQARTGFVANYVFLEAGSYKISEIVSKEFKSKIGGTTEKKTDAGSACAFNDFTVVKTSTTAPAFAVATAGLYKVSYDATSNEAILYEIKDAGVIGDATPNGWSSDTKLATVGSITKDGAAWQAKGVLLRQGQWKIRFNCRWSLDRRIDPTKGFLAANGYQMFTNFGGTVIDLKTGNDGTNIPVAADKEGVYTIDITWTAKDGVKANITKTADAPPIAFDPNKYKFGVIGDATAKAWDADRDMWYKKDGTTHKWVGVYTFIADKEYKFRINDAWDFSLGGDLANLAKGGANIKSPGTGAYYVTLSTADDGKTWKATVEKKSWSLIGAGSPGLAWDKDTELVAEVAAGGIESYTATGDFTTDEWKFRAGGAWDLNVGGTLATLVVDGGNLKLTTAGKYKVTLKFDGSNWSGEAIKQ